MARKILLADDSVTAQNMGRKILTDAGYEVVAVNNGSAALKKIVELKPDLIVLDVYMPGYSGLEVCQRIKENRDTARIPVLLTVGKLEPFKPEEARRARADAFVVKPFEASELISALTKLEEKIGPQPEPYKPGRFAKAIASLDESEAPAGNDRFGDSDSGWKSRLRFPGRKKQAEPEEAPEVAAPSKSFRDLRSEPAPVVKTPSAVPEFERPIPSGIPRDITPEEIAAISAAAARLSTAGVHVVDETSEPQGPIQVPSLESAPPSAAELEPSAQPQPSSEPMAVTPERSSSDDTAPMTFASAPTVVEDKSAEGMPVEPPVSSVAEAETKPSPATETAISSPAEQSGAPGMVAADQPAPVASAVAIAATPAPVASSSTESAPALAIEAPADPQVPAETLAVTPEIGAELSVAAIESPATTEPQSATQPPPQVEPTFDSRVEAQPEPAPQIAESGPAPVGEAITFATAQDEEVMAALQNLIPATGSANGAQATNASEIASSLVAAVAEFAPRGIPVSRPRWIAEEAALTPEEAALSLEQEMEKAYAAFAATEAARILATSAIESLTSTQQSTTVATLTEMATAIVEPHHTAEFAPKASTSEAVPALEASTVAVPAAIEIPAVSQMESAAASAESGTVASAPSLAETPAQQMQTEILAATNSGNAVATPELPVGSSEPQRPTVTDFVVAASPIRDAIADAVSADPAYTVVAAPPDPMASALDDHSTFSAGDEDSMAKNSETGFKMIRQTPAGSKAVGTAPVTKENFDAPAKAAEPAAMAAAAAAESAPAVPPMPATAPDPRAIASIVDSVLAELRPKIVEEIAKKLAEPNK